MGDGDPVDARRTAEIIAAYLDVRDDIGSAVVDSDDPTLVIVTTQGQRPLLVYVEEAQQG